jgi:hypothetical protein
MTMQTEDTVNAAGYTPTEPGDYTLEIVESDYVANARGNGMVAKFECRVCGLGAYAGRPFYINLNLEHENQQAQDIAQRDFAALRRAVGVLAPQNTVELHHIDFLVHIGAKPRKDTGDPENFVRAYIMRDDGSRQAARSKIVHPPGAPAAAAPQPNRPWQRAA